MRAVAEYVMRGRSQAITVAVLAGILPLMQWLSNSVVALVILRKGLLEGLLLSMWTFLPAGLFFYLSGNPSPVLALVGTLILAATLRLTMSWELTLAACVGVGILSGWFYELFAMEFVSQFAEFFLELLKSNEMAGGLTPEAMKTSSVDYLVLGQVWVMVGVLLLARWWQSVLYNPGGFQKEFHGLRLSPALAMGLVVGVVLMAVVEDSGINRYQQLFVLPLVVAGLGLAHWYMNSRKTAINWVPMFYVLFVLLLDKAYLFVAALGLLDSWVNMREKIGTSD